MDYAAPRKDLPHQHVAKQHDQLLEVRCPDASCSPDRRGSPQTQSAWRKSWPLTQEPPLQLPMKNLELWWIYWILMNCGMPLFKQRGDWATTKLRVFLPGYHLVYWCLLVILQKGKSVNPLFQGIPWLMIKIPSQTNSISSRLANAASMRCHEAFAKAVPGIARGLLQSNTTSADGQEASSIN